MQVNLGLMRTVTSVCLCLLADATEMGPCQDSEENI